jgi:alanine-glyoxylate transaminase/(R)-3-amino-2-methylpropionate-pyruvate transaminase
MARLYTGKFDIVSLRNGYHGMSPYTMGLTALHTWKFNTPTGFGIQHTMNPGKISQNLFYNDSDIK